jgi:L-serine dehydratase
VNHGAEKIPQNRLSYKAVISVFDIFKVGVGPSSSHTMGPMRAGRLFAEALDEGGPLARVHRVQVDLFGSLALTGRGHATDRALLVGLEGDTPEALNLETYDARVAAIQASHRLTLLGRHPIAFDAATDIVWHTAERLPRHTNGMRMSAWDAAGTTLLTREYYSVGGGFLLGSTDGPGTAATTSGPLPNEVPFPFHSADQLLAMAHDSRKTIAEVVDANERTWRGGGAIRDGLLRLWDVMRACMERGLAQEGILPGGLNVRRRAPRLARRLRERAGEDPLQIMDWVSVWAMAVNEENAAGGRVVTAPTNGAAGLLPAVLQYYVRFVDGASDAGVVRFLLTAGAIGMLFKENASISGAEVGCQGEVGVACSMAAGGLVAAQAGTNDQIEQAAEIGMEHHLGMTCDPVGGLVQIPCIERNAVGAVKAINAARLAMSGDGDHKVSLDQVIETMKRTGADMQTRYKETSLGGLALTLTEC